MNNIDEIIQQTGVKSDNVSKKKVIKLHINKSLQVIKDDSTNETIEEEVKDI